MSITVTKKLTGKAAMISGKALLNSSPFHQGEGVPDPFYRTWWFFESATKADGKTVDDTLAAQLAHVQVCFSEGFDRFFDRMPRRSARNPVIKFVCSHNAEGVPFQPMGDDEHIPPQPYTVSVDSMALPDDHKHPVPSATQQQPKITSLSHKSAKQTFTGTLSFDSKAVLPAEATRVRLPPGGASGAAYQAAKQNPTYVANAADAKSKSQACRNVLCTTDMKGATSAGADTKCTVKFSLHREPKKNTLELVHPNGTVLHFSTDDKLPVGKPAAAAAPKTPAKPAAPSASGGSGAAPASPTASPAKMTQNPNKA